MVSCRCRRRGALLLLLSVCPPPVRWTVSLPGRLNHPRADCCAATVGGKVYVAGGWTTDYMDTLGSVEVRQAAVQPIVNDRCYCCHASLIRDWSTCQFMDNLRCLLNPNNIGFRQPRTGFRQPRTGFRQPRTGFRQPRTGFRQPRTGFRQPRTGFRHPRTGFRQPRTGFRHSRHIYMEKQQLPWFHLSPFSWKTCITIHARSGYK
jgi:hypothetical protein